MIEILPKKPHLETLRSELLTLAESFAGDAKPLAELLSTMVADVARASHERLEIFPVCHHSPASALHLLRRLKGRPPRVIFMEMCEDLRVCLDGLRNCRLPVALQAFAASSEVFPAAWAPLSVVAPITEFSAEYQAIAYALERPDTTSLVFVDRSVDHIFQWMPKDDGAVEQRVGEEDDEDDGAPADASGEGPAPKASHGSAIGVQIGNIEPTFDAFLTFLLKNARVRHFAEWWDQYVEQAVIGGDYETYRHVMFLVGSLLRRLGRKEENLREDRLRERYMWTRMKQYLREHSIDAGDAIYICGAAHSGSEVEEFGTANDKVWDIPEKSSTKWLYGLIPSSFLAIERQFHHPPGTVSICESSWNKALAAMELTPFRIAKAAPKAADTKSKGKGAKGEKAKESESPKADPKAEASAAPVTSEGMRHFLTRPPELSQCDEEELLHWCVEIVKSARDNGYLTSTADSIAIYQTAMLLAGIRNRLHPSPYDFQDAAITCLEKDRTPKKRNIRKLCEMLLGGDKVGLVGYDSLPPLAKDVYDRLKLLGLNLDSSNIQRALIDFKARPDLIPCSDLLWRLSYLVPRTSGGYLVYCTMGERKLGGTPIQESWDLALRKQQGLLIALGYEGVSVESVVEKRLKTAAFAPKAGPAAALRAVTDSLLYLKSPRLTGELGERAIALLTEQTGGHEAPQVFELARALVHYYRSTPLGLPEWIKQFITTGYSHYATLLPVAFQDRSAHPKEVAGMLAFMFTLESLALSLGCERSQFEIAIKQAGPGTDDPTKLGLLWSAEWLLGLRDVAQIRGFLDEVLRNVMMLPAFPAYINGFLLALGFTPLVGKLVVELLSRAFEHLPDEVLMPWMPSLIMGLRPLGAELITTLIKEASMTYPPNLKALGNWTPPWQEAGAEEANTTELAEGETAAAGPELSPGEGFARSLCENYPATTNALAAIFGESADGWQKLAEPKPQAAKAAGGGAAKAEAGPTPATELLTAYPAALSALAKMFEA